MAPGKHATRAPRLEQNVSRALSPVQRAYVVEAGSVIMNGRSGEPADNKQVQAAYRGI